MQTTRTGEDVCRIVGGHGDTVYKDSIYEKTVNEERHGEVPPE